MAKISEIVSEPLIGRMRLQWWRDTLDRLYAGQTVAHGVAQPLGIAIAAAGLSRAAFDPLIDAREFDLDRTAPVDLPALYAYAEGTGAPLLGIALQMVGGDAPSEEVARKVGMAWALTGLLRALPFHARQRRTFMPADMMQAAGVRVGRLFDLKPDPGLSEVVRTIGEQARGLFSDARPLVGKLPRAGRSPALLIELGQLYLRDLAGAAWNPFVLETRPPRRFTAARLALTALIKRY